MAVQGEEQKKLDVLSNEVFVKALVSSGRTVIQYRLAVYVLLQISSVSETWQWHSIPFCAVCSCVWRERGGHYRRRSPPRKVCEIYDSTTTMFFSVASYQPRVRQDHGDCFVSSEAARVPFLFRYCVCFDPLDGSSNIDCGVSIGTVSVTFINRADLLWFQLSTVNQRKWMV